MKKLLFFLMANVIAINIAFSQGAAINISGFPSDPSAMLDVSSTTSGLLIPRMTEAQRTAIHAPATGLMVYQTNNVTGYWYFNGTSWVQAIGSQGPTGSQGIQGLPGQTGAQGTMGATGAASTVPGPTGPQGPTGANGATGTTGVSHGKQVFTSNGTFNVPSGVTTVWVSMCGGGGSGGYYGPGGGGGGGANAIALQVTVTPLEAVTITVGAGGAPVSGPNNSNGKVGTSSTFGSYVTTGGGGAGSGSGPGGAGGTGSTGTIPGCPGISFGNYMSYGGAGGNSLFGFGGVSTSYPGVAGIGYGSGGSGSAYSGSSTGAGAPGIVIVEW